MVIGTLFILSPSPRSNWYPALVKYLNLDLDVVTDKNDPTFLENFPLKKFPSFLGADGFKVTEAIAILDYLASLAPNSKLFGESIEDKAQVLRWLSFFNSDFADSGIRVWFQHNSKEEKNIYSDKLINYLKYIDNELSSRKYLVVENKITVGEISAFVCVDHFAKFVGGIDPYPNIVRWKKELINENNFFASLLE